MTADIKVARSPKPKKSEGIKVQPALDHYWSQKDYPYLAISLYNLIPSCYLCNSIIKRDHKLSYSEHIHPYSHSLHKKVFFDVKIKNIKAFLSDPNEFEIEIKQKNHKDAQRGINSAEFFGLKDLFNQHKDYVAEILLKKQAYTKDWLATVKSLTKLNITLEDAMRVYYGNYLKEEDIDKRPLSKLTIDIIFGKSGTPSTNGGGGGILTPSSINS
jgi:hypothetical protein